MKPFPILLWTVLLVAIVSGQPTQFPAWPMPPVEPIEPFQIPGEIIPGTNLTVKYVINAFGGIWQQDRTIDSMAYVCTDILPYIASVIPEVDESSIYWGPLCDDVIRASNDLDAFDATGWCNGIITMFTNLTAQESGVRYRRESAASVMHYSEVMNDPLHILEIVMNITRDLYDIDINMIIDDFSSIHSICTDIQKNFLRPSLQDIILEFEAELMSTLLPMTEPICQDLDAFLESFAIYSSSPGYPIIKDAIHLVAQAFGYGSTEELCQAIIETLNVQDDNGEARLSFSTARILSLYEIPENAERCSVFASSFVNDFIEPVINLDISDMSDKFEVTNDMIHQYTGFQSPKPLDSICRFVENAFTTVVDLPDPVPFRFFESTNLTIEFFINAAGGMWLHERTIDSLAFGCTEVLPDLLSMVPDPSMFSQVSQPICSEIVAANDLDAFDAESACNELTATINDLTSMDSGNRMRRQGDSHMGQGDFDILEILDNTMRHLYGIDISDQSTICPNIKQFLEPSLPELVTRFLGELTSALLPEANRYVCSDWGVYLPTVGISNTSLYEPVIYAAADLGSQILGYASRDEICVAIREALAAGGDASRVFGRAAFESVIDIFTDIERCMVIGNDAIDKIVEPLVRVGYYNMFEVTRYVMTRYTGYNGVKDICRALETSFTQLFSSTVMISITGETLNGEELEYTIDLNDRTFPAFKRLEEVFCGVVVNVIKEELGSDLRRVECVAKSFSPGSVVADLELLVHSTTQAKADDIARDVAKLSTDDSLVLSSDGNSLVVSELQAAAGNGEKQRSLSAGAIITIALGVVTAGLW